MFANSDSKYISFVDGDDWIHRQFLELMVSGITQYRVNLCQCGFTLTNGSEEPQETQNEHFLCISPKEQYINHYCSYICMNLFHRSVWQNTRFPEGQIYEDLAIWYKILFAQEKITIVDSVLYYYFLNPNGTMRSAWHPGMLARMDAWDAQLAFFNQRGDQELLESAVKRYCMIAFHEYKAIGESGKLTESETKKYQAILRRKIRRVLIKNSTIVKQTSYYRLFIQIAFPVYDWCFWTAQGVAGKIKRTIRFKR
jgi:glycosyltransferase involved in cell wall biosynthesis